MSDPEMTEFGALKDASSRLIDTISEVCAGQSNQNVMLTCTYLAAYAAVETRTPKEAFLYICGTAFDTNAENNLNQGVKQ